MARKSLQDLSGIANTIARSGNGERERSKTSAPALGALQGALTAIRELDTDLIDDWGPVDRMDGFTTVNSDEEMDGFEALKDSIRDGGQQVPILVRRKAGGRYEAIYGRRRLQACRELGIKVRANIQDMEDADALLAKGLENAARRNLSFYEKARFAEAIREAGHDSATVRKVLNLSKSQLSHLTKVTDNIPPQTGKMIGPAPRSGRPKWTALAELFARGQTNEARVSRILNPHLRTMSSDERLDHVLREETRRGARTAKARTMTPVPGVTIKSGATAIAVQIDRKGQGAGFADWLDRNLEDIIRRSHAEFAQTRSGDEE